MTKIVVTEKDIRLGTLDRYNPRKCVIARALRHCLPWWRTLGFVCVGVEECNIGFRKKQLPPIASQLIRDVMFGEPVEPIEFEI